MAVSCMGDAFATAVPSRTDASGNSRWERGEVGDLKSQVEQLYRTVGEKLNIDYLYVKILHMIAGGKAVFADTMPDIYMDQTVSAMPGAFDLPGAEQDYDRLAPWAECADKTVVRPSGHYLPDAAYNVAADVVAIMNSRLTADRGSMQGYFDVLETGVKRQVLFCEAVLQYMGSPEEANRFFVAYLKLLDGKDSGENLLVSTASGVAFKEKFRQILTDNGIAGEGSLRALSIIFSFDGCTAASAGAESVCTESVLPYELGLTSRENMMQAAMSLVGKCRYVWGGGHLGTGRIKGINPMWKIFSDSYGDEKGEDGYTKCIIPDGSWCPLHGSERDWDACLYSSKTSYSLEQYLEEREGVLDLSSVDVDALAAMLEPVVDFSEGMTSHRLDGLDCSGYTTWLFNQITSDRYRFDAGALAFIGQYGMKRLSSGNNLKPGDLFSWGDHIVVIVGALKPGSRAYVVLESGPSNVKFGVACNGSINTADALEALEVAQEANLLLGNMNEDEKTRRFSMYLRYSGSSAGDPWKGYRAWGRLRQKFVDEETILEAYGKTITELTAREIIQHTMEQMPYQYISGMDSYEGSLFDLESIRESQTTVETAGVDWTNIVLSTELR